MSDLMLLIIGLVGTTVAPWQLFFQQSYVIDKRITPRFIRYERLDLWLGIALVIVGAGAIIAFTAAAFAGRRNSEISPTRAASPPASRNMPARRRA